VEEIQSWSAAQEEVSSGADCPLTATHFSFLPLPASTDLSDSSSEVTLSSVSPSIPVLLSDSELDDVPEDSLEDV
jgi:hypothetical protein